MRTREQAIVADAVEPVRQHMDEEASDKLGGGKAHDVVSVAIVNAIVFPAERDGFVIRTDQTAV